jgi:hypothetical protein
MNITSTRRGGEEERRGLVDLNTCLSLVALIARGAIEMWLPSSS